MTKTMEQYMSKTRGDYGSCVNRPKIDANAQFKLKEQFLKELHDNTFSGSEHEDANEHIEKVLEIVGLFHIPNITQDQVMLQAFLVSLTGAASRWLRNQPPGSITTWEALKSKLDVPTRQIPDSKGAIPTKTAADAKVAIQEMAKYSQKWHNGTSRSRSTKTSNGLAAIQAQLNNLKREIKKVNKKVYAAHVGCEVCKGPHYTKDCPLKEERKTLEESYYTQFGAPYQTIGQYRATGSGFYQRNNANSLYPDRRQTLEESLTKFMGESTKRHKENSNIMKEIRASTDATIRNQGALIKTLEIQIGQMSKVLQARGIESLPSSTEPNPRDHVKSISTAKADSARIRRIGSGPYTVSESQYNNLFSETVPFPK
ncbi:retrovirus-related pol polyprotein from transposon TNT 1-94 [Tanacetum coccineum]